MQTDEKNTFGDELNYYFEREDWREDSKKYHLLSNGLKLLHCDGLSEVSRMVDIRALDDCHVIRQ